MYRSAARGSRVLIAAPWQRDGDSLWKVLTQDGYHASVYPSLLALSTDINDETGVVILTQEALAHGMDALQRALKHQPTWSDVPFVVLRSARLGHASGIESLPPEVINRIELERPTGSASLLSAVATAMRSRQKQFEIKDRMDELAASQKALAESESELRQIADSLPVLIALVDRHRRYRFVNQAFHAWFNVSPENMLGKTMEDVFGTDTSDICRNAFDKALSGETARIELTWRRPDGEQREIEIRYIPRQQEERRIDGVHFFATDITERKASLEAARHAAATLEHKVAQRTAELQAEMRARSESEAALRQAQKMEAVGQLTGGIAHDFNNMLTSIIGALDIIEANLQGECKPKLERVVRIASESAGRATALIRRLLAFSRRQTLNPKPVDVNELVQSMHMLLSQTLGERIQIQVDLMTPLDKALVDVNQLESALLNLCINARDAMPDGGQLRIATRPASSIPLLPKGSVPNALGYLVLEVTDNGVGMEPAVKERIFEPFFTTKPIGQGTGLGLSMIYGFIQQSKGHVDVRSAPGKGTTISLFLPVAPATESLADSLKNAGIPKGEGQRILVVEDDDQVRFLVSYLLEELGYVVTAARDATAAMPYISALNHIDLLISDVGLPGMNGRQLAEFVREVHPAVPVLFMTGYAESAAVKSKFLGPNMTIIAKPFAREDFSRAVQQVLADVQTVN